MEMEGIGDECFNEGVFLVLVCACAGNISSFGGSENMGAVAIRRIRGGIGRSTMKAVIALVLMAVTAQALNVITERGRSSGI